MTARARTRRRVVTATARAAPRSRIGALRRRRRATAAPLAHHQPPRRRRLTEWSPPSGGHTHTGGVGASSRGSAPSNASAAPDSSARARRRVSGARRWARRPASIRGARRLVCEPALTRPTRRCSRCRPSSLRDRAAPQVVLFAGQTLWAAPTTRRRIRGSRSATRTLGAAARRAVVAEREAARTCHGSADALPLPTNPRAAAALLHLRRRRAPAAWSAGDAVLARRPSEAWFASS